MRTKTEAFIEALKQNNPGCEAVALYQDGRMVLEHHFVPSVPRCIYSHTKSYVATAAGIAMDEGKLKLTDKLVDLFPEYEAVITDERMRRVTLRHVLTMSSGIGDALLMGGHRQNGEGFPDYRAYFFSRAMKYEPGEKFVYSNADTHMVGCAVQKAVGETLQRYLYRKLFSKLGIGYPTWECDPSGTAFGGSAMYLQISQMMKLGILYLNDGVWNGERILSSDWIREAGLKQIDTGTGSSWNDSYGYQFWMQPNGRGFRADGAYCQFSIVLPEENAVLVTQCSEQNGGARFLDILMNTALK